MSDLFPSSAPSRAGEVPYYISTAPLVTNNPGRALLQLLFCMSPQIPTNWRKGMERRVGHPKAGTFQDADSSLGGALRYLCSLRLLVQPARGRRNKSVVPLTFIRHLMCVPGPPWTPGRGSPQSVYPFSIRAIIIRTRGCRQSPGAEASSFYKG